MKNKYETEVDLKKTFVELTNILSTISVKGNDVETMYSARLTLKQLFEKIEIIEEGQKDNPSK